MRATAPRPAMGVRRLPVRGTLVSWTAFLFALAVSVRPGCADEFRLAEGESAGPSGGIEQTAGESDRSARDEQLDKRVRILEKGSSSRAARRAALAALPLNKLQQDERQRAMSVLRDVSLFRELPVLECDVEPEVYRYFTRHPDVAVSIWRAMEISEFQMTRAGESSYKVSSGDGTTGQVDVLHQSDDESLVVCTGLFKNPLVLTPIHATGLFHLQTTLVRREDGTPVATYRGRMFVSFPSQTVGTVAKVISPVSNIIIDRNFREVSLFLHMMSLAMRKQPGWIERMTRRLKGVPAESQIELLQLTAEMYVAARKRELAAAGQAADGLTADELLPPVAAPSGTSPSSTDSPANRPRVASEGRPASN